MKAFLSLILSFMMSSTIVFAAPGMSTYVSTTPQFRVDAILKLKAQHKQSKDEMLKRLDQAIVILEKSDHKNNIETNLARIEKMFDNNFKKFQKRATQLLANRKKFILAFNDAVALNLGLTQYEFKQSLVDATQAGDFTTAKEDALNELKKAGTLSNYLRDMRSAIAENRLDSFIAKGNSKKELGRSIASLDLGFLVSNLVAITVVAAASIVTGIAIIALGVSLSVGLGLVIWPFALSGLIIIFVAASL